MAEKKIKNIKLGNVKIVYSGDFPKGLILKRDLTPTEAMYICEKLLGYAITDLWLSDEDMDREERRDFNETLAKDLSSVLKGDAGEDWFNSEYAPDCYDDRTYGIFYIPVLSYLQKKGII